MRTVFRILHGFPSHAKTYRAPARFPFWMEGFRQKTATGKHFGGFDRSRHQLQLTSPIKPWCGNGMKTNATEKKEEEEF